MLIRRAKDRKKVTILYQCVVNPQVQDQLSVLGLMVHTVFERHSKSEELRRAATHNLGEANSVLIQLLGSLGFTIAAEQVRMTKSFLRQ